ncbi:hypothetical protein MRX96_023328 [Rhipicephalus microplus]
MFLPSGLEPLEKKCETAPVPHFSIARVHGERLRSSALQAAIHPPLKERTTQTSKVRAQAGVPYRRRRMDDKPEAPTACLAFGPACPLRAYGLDCYPTREPPRSSRDAPWSKGRRGGEMERRRRVWTFHTALFPRPLCMCDASIQPITLHTDRYGRRQVQG